MQGMKRFAKTMCGVSLITSAAFGQAGVSGLSGTVTDSKGAVLPNASVVVTNETSHAVRKDKTDGAGHFAESGLPAGLYTVEVSAPGFGTMVRKSQAAGGPEFTVALPVASANDQVTVEAASSGSVAAQYAPMDALLNERSARTEVSSQFIQNFTTPLADYSEVIQMAPGTFSVNANGIGLGDSKTYFRGFSDGNYDITFDGIPFEDTNSPTHHSWAFFPSQWLGGVDFDRSPGTASTVGPTPFGGSINLLSRETPSDQNIRFGVSYGSFNSLLYDGHYDSGNFGGETKRNNVFVDVHHLTSDGYETFNFQTRNAGSTKYQLRISDKATLTGFAGVVWLDSNTPNIKGPTRAQVAQFGDNFLLQGTDATQANYYKYNFYHVPTDFEYVGYKKEFGQGWVIDTKPYTYSYYNQQNYAATPKSGVISTANCSTPVKGVIPCGTDKLNSYRKYGEITSLSKASRFGVFRTGMWYEFAKTDRHQIPQDPTTLKDDVLPFFSEQFNTNSYQPFAEYEYHATGKLTISGGMKFAHYTQDLKQYADNGKTIGNLGGAPFRISSAGYTSYLPSADVNYHIKNNWSVYGQFATGSVIPPSNVFDTTGTIKTLPKPSYAKTYQAGSVVKVKRATLDVDAYYIHFGNAYTAPADPNNVIYTSSGDSVSKGFEGQMNLYLARGLSLYANGTAGSARYVSETVPGTALVGGAVTQVANPNLHAWVATTPANTETLGLTYQQKYFDVGMFNKRIGPMWNDGTFASGTAANQVIPIDPFNLTNLFVNYTIRNGGRFDQTKLRLSLNNLLDQHSLTGVTQAATGNVYTPGPGDTLTLLPGRSVVMSVTFGLAPKR